MTETEKRETYLDWIKVYCRNDFTVNGEEVIPPMIELVIDEMIEHDSKQEVQSESLGDYSVTFSNEGYPKKTLIKLNPYRKVKFV